MSCVSKVFTCILTRERKTQLRAFLKKIGGRKVSWPLLDQSLTHSSFANEESVAGKPLLDNERLEYLGDSVLSLALSERLYQEFPDFSEGQLSRIRAAAVSQESLWRVARKLDLGSVIQLGKGEEKGGGRSRRSILASGLEALLAALYLGGGIKEVQKFLKKHLEPEIRDIILERRGTDHKSRLQEEAQKRYHLVPVYRLVRETGLEHRRIFEVRVSIADGLAASGKGHSKKAAEQSAARRALESLKKSREKKTRAEPRGSSRGVLGER